MKKHNPYFLILIVLLTYQVNAQVVYERTYPYEFPSVESPIEFPDSSTFSLGERSYCGGIGTRHIDAQGNELTENIFSAEVFSSGYNWIGHDSVLIWAEEGALDVGSDSFRVYIWTSIELNKILSIDIRDTPSNSVEYGAFLYSPDRLVYRRSDTLYSLNLISNQVEENLIIADINQVIEFEESILVLSATAYPVLLNDQLEVIQLWADLSFLPFQVNTALVLDSFLVGRNILNPLSIGVFNVYNESQSILDLSAYFNQVDEIQSNKKNLFVKGVSNDDEVVLQLDSTTSLVDLTTLDIPEVDKQLAYSYYPERVYAWGYNGLANYKANYRMCYNYLKANPIHYIDIAWDTIWVDSIHKYPPEWHIPANVFVSALVRNLSSDTIHSLTIHFEDIPVFWCDNGVYATHMENLSILPNTMDTISFWTSSYAAGQDLPFVRTFFAQHGNEHLDMDWTNNFIVLNHLISGQSDLKSIDMSVFPNPFTNFLRLEDASEAIQLKLFDQTGRIVVKGIGQLDDLGRLPSGYYVLQAIDATTNRVSRVVKVE